MWGHYFKRKMLDSLPTNLVRTPLTACCKSCWVKGEKIGQKNEELNLGERINFWPVLQWRMGGSEPCPQKKKILNIFKNNKWIKLGGILNQISDKDLTKVKKVFSNFSGMKY